MGNGVRREGLVPVVCGDIRSVGLVERISIADGQHSSQVCGSAQIYTGSNPR